jgi:hypothetical protein
MGQPFIQPRKRNPDGHGHHRVSGQDGVCHFVEQAGYLLGPHAQEDHV